MRNAVLFGLSLLLLSACDRDPKVAADAGPAAPTALARLRGLKGPVTLERAERRRPAAEESLFARDVVETGPASEAQLHFADGRVVEVGPGARLMVGEDATGLLLEVQRGFVLSRVPRTEGARPSAEPEVAIRILTPFGLTRIGGGESEVAFEVGKDSARVDVKLGAVELVDASGASQRAEAGESLQLSQGAVELLGREPKQEEVVMLAPLQVTIYADGKAELRKKGERRWRLVGKKGQEIAEGDHVRVRRGTSRLALGGSDTSLRLDDGTELVLGKVARQGEVEESAFQLKKGRLDLALAKGKKSRVAVDDYSLESEGGGYFHVEKTRDGLAVSAVTGALRLRRGEASVEVSAGEVARVGKAGVEAARVQRQGTPELVLPSRTGLKVFHPGVPAALIEWRGEPAEYEVRVGRDPAFSELVLEGTVRASRVAVEIPRRGPLYWEVKDKAGARVDSGSASFAPEPPLRDLERLRNEVPEGPDKTTIYYQDKPPAVTFTYAEEPGAAQYRVAVFRQGELEKPVAERKVAQLAAPLEAGLLSEGSYVWSVTPLSGAGEELRGGRMNKLDILYDNSVPTLLVRSPLNGQRVGRQVRTHGSAPVGSRLYVNGREVALDDKSRFDTEVSPAGTPPTIVYRLVRSNAADAFYVRAVKRGGQ